MRNRNSISKQLYASDRAEDKEEKRFDFASRKSIESEIHFTSSLLPTDDIDFEVDNFGLRNEIKIDRKTRHKVKPYRVSDRSLEFVLNSNLLPSPPDVANIFHWLINNDDSRRPKRSRTWRFKTKMNKIHKRSERAEQRFFHENLFAEGIEMSGQDHRSAQLGSVGDSRTLLSRPNKLRRRSNDRTMWLFSVDNYMFRRKNRFLQRYVG